ncbi:AAA family ATPase [Pedobacter sp. GSP4]|uniref:AAA family ATPase n=1 Tax=Pedobacter sp. GSP4 TaxID=3453716 RepID=UPI003EEC7A64
MFISDLIISDKQHILLDDIILEPANRSKLDQLIREHRFAEELLQYGLPLDNKILLHGSSGCGKTTAAKAIAAALGKKLLILNLSNVISARVGETAQNIKTVFDKAAKDKSVLFLDEFDQIGKVRSIDDRDVGELRRLINSMIQLIDYFPQDALLICATNHQSFIDPALLRRFQLSLGFSLPSNEILDGYYDKLLSAFPTELTSITRRYGISFAEARDYTFTSVKAILLAKLEKAESALV